MTRFMTLLLAGLATALAATPAPANEPLAAPGPHGPLAGTLVRPAEGRPVVLIVPGSGPTDRDGNNPLGVTAAPYRLLAEALAARGIGTLRIDKRGMFASKAALADPNDATIGAYADDVAAWIAAAREATGRECVWLAGHSEGGLIALAAAQRPLALCGVILIAAPGQPLAQVIRDQLAANPANAPLLGQADAALADLVAGRRTDVAAMHPALQGLFAPPVQGFLIDMFGHDPARLAATVAVPMLIVQGGKDLQIGRGNGDALHAARPDATYLVIPDMNHVLKPVAGDSPQANFAAYGDPALPVAPELVEAIAGFVTAAGKGS